MKRVDPAKLREEILACGRDPCYFIKKYVRIQHPVRGLIPFKLFDYQEQLVHDYRERRFNIILKARQLGISEVTAAYALWLILFHRDKNVVVMASKAETAKNIIRKVRTAFKKLPKNLLLADALNDNVLSLELSNGSRIKAITTSGDAGRSEAVSLLIVDEAAFVERFDELWTGLYPTVAAGGSAIVLSTPNGVGNKFHQLYVDAEQGENDFKATRLMWWKHPERVAGLKDDPNRPGFKTSPWYEKEVRASNMSPRDVAQELECDFISSGATFIDSAYLELLTKGLLDALSMELPDRALFLWWEAQKQRRYFISADVATGHGRDYSAAIVWDVDTMEQQAEYYGKIPPDEFAKVLVDLGHRYNTALLVVENNSVGLACLEHLKLAAYENLYYSRKGDGKPGEAVHAGWGATSDDLVAGFTTSPKTRPLLLAKLEEYIRNKTVTFRSKRLHEELRTFIWNAGRPEAMKGYNDDLVMSAAIGVWIRDTFINPGAATLDVQRQLLGGITMEKNLNTAIPGASKDPAHARTDIRTTVGIFSEADPRRSIQAQLRVRLPNGRVADFGWLLQSSKG